VEAVAGVIRITSLMYSKGWKISLGIILGKSHWILQHPLAQHSIQLKKHINLNNIYLCYKYSLIFLIVYDAKFR
jgi:hypothetical protein